MTPLLIQHNGSIDQLNHQNRNTVGQMSLLTEPNLHIQVFAFYYRVYQLDI